MGFCETSLSHPIKIFFIKRSKAVLLLWIIFAINVSCVCVMLSCLFIAALWSPMERADLVARLCVMFLVFCHFPM